MTKPDPYQEPPLIRKIIYDFVLWILSRIFDCFFREIRTRGAFKIPKTGPVIFVAAPHANQFVDPVILMGQVAENSHRRVSFLIAEKSLHRAAIGTFARCAMSIGVTRPQDNLKTASGTFTVDPENPLRIVGKDTKFTKDCSVKGLIGLPKSLCNVEVAQIISDTELLIRKPFKDTPQIQALISNGTVFKTAPKVDQSAVYEKVFAHLAHNQSIGIFPEGGSHDRTDLLPLKAGVAIMALGTMNEYPDANVKIVPCGMNYFHPHKFRSRAVVEFGDPIEISKETLAKYKNPETNRDAVKELLDEISEGLKAVTVTCPDYETLMVVQATRRLYAGQRYASMPLPVVVETNRRLVMGYQKFKDDPKIIKIKEDVLKYNEQLHTYHLPDHCVETAQINLAKNTFLLVARSVRLMFYLVLALPGIVMFSPVFIVAKRISKNKAKEALAGSTVKINANDVIATWKILIGMGFAPLLYIFWSSLLTYYFRNCGLPKYIVFSGCYLASALVTYSALIIGDNGMDVLKSLRPLYLSIVKPNGLRDLKKTREVLRQEITEMVNLFGPEIFPDFDVQRLRSRYEKKFDEEEEDRKTEELRQRRKEKRKQERLARKAAKDVTSESESVSDAISLMNSDNSYSNIPIFSNGRNNSSSSMASDFGADDHKDDLIMNAMRERRAE